MAEDYYSVLGVPKNASPADIQKAYRELARKYHPDMNPGDKTAKKKFQKVQAAFDVLNNPEKREMYDRYGSSFETMGGQPQGARPWTWSPGAGGAGPAGFGVEDIDLSQFLGERFGQEAPGGVGDLFGQFRRAAGKFRKPAAGSPGRGGDLVQELQIPFATAITGGEVQISVARPRGKPETLEVKIPAGIEDGKKIRIRGHGQPAPRGGTPGDILLTVRVLPHPYFHRRGNQLLVRVPVTLGEAVFGRQGGRAHAAGDRHVERSARHFQRRQTPRQRTRCGAQNGAPGDLLAEIQIVLPKQLSDADRQAIRQIDQHYSQNPRSDLRW